MARSVIIVFRLPAYLEFVKKHLVGRINFMSLSKENVKQLPFNHSVYNKK